MSDKDKALQACKDRADKLAKVSAALEEQEKHMNQYMKLPIVPNISPWNIGGTGTFGTTTGNDEFANREHGPEVSKIITNHGNGFWSDIRIHQDDFVYYKLFRGRFAKLLCALSLGALKPKDVEGYKHDWKFIGNQGQPEYKLEAELGKTFLKIDELITAELKKEQKEKAHKKFIKGIAKTDPENLKMIAGLKTLDEGMTAPLEEPQQKTRKKAQYQPISVPTKQVAEAFSQEMLKKLKDELYNEIGKAP